MDGSCFFGYLLSLMIDEIVIDHPLLFIEFEHATITIADTEPQ